VIASLPAASTWETDPTVALAAIERMRLQPDSPSPRESLARLAHDCAKGGAGPCPILAAFG